MGYKWKGHKTFVVDDVYSFECKWQNTSYGFRHFASLLQNGCVVSTGKCCYYNRTWERYEYQSVIYDAISKSYLPDEVKDMLNEWTKEGKNAVKEEMDALKMVGMIAKLGELFGSSTEEANSWKKRMLNTVNGIQFPDDFDSLSEEEKQKRLDNAIKVVTED